jgi:hypothetical protein
MTKNEKKIACRTSDSQRSDIVIFFFMIVYAGNSKQIEKRQMSVKEVHFCSAMPDLLGKDRRISRKNRAVFLEDTKWLAGETIKIAFIGGTPEQWDHVQKTASIWLRYANLVFEWRVPVQESDVRISFVSGGGSWSFMGRQARSIGKEHATMNFGWLSDKPDPSETGTILHEFGHCLGLAHEHFSPHSTLTWKRDVVIESLSGPPNSWSVDKIEANVFSKYEKTDASVAASAFDPKSIMLYSFPASWTEEGIATEANSSLSREDKVMMTVMYPHQGITIDVDDEPVNACKCSCFPAKAIVQSIARRMRRTE